MIGSSQDGRVVPTVRRSIRGKSRAYVEDAGADRCCAAGSVCRHGESDAGSDSHAYSASRDGFIEHPQPRCHAEALRDGWPRRHADIRHDGSPRQPGGHHPGCFGQPLGCRACCDCEPKRYPSQRSGTQPDNLG